MTYVPEATPGDERPAPGEGSSSGRGFGCALEIIETLVLTLVIYLLIHNFVAQPFEVEQNSMVPTVNPGEYVLIDKLSPRFSDYQRGDIVVFQPPNGFGQGGVPFIKRVIGTPGDFVRLENGVVFITAPGGSPVRLDEPYVIRGVEGTAAATLPRDPSGTAAWTVPAGSYFVMGDNRTASQDSRFFGPVSRDLIVGRAWLRYFPLDRIGVVARPEYPGLPSQVADQAALMPRYVLGGSSATIQASIARW